MDQFLFNIILTPITTLSIILVVFIKRKYSFLIGMIVFVVITLPIVHYASDNIFYKFQLLCYAIFIHGIILSLSFSVILKKRSKSISYALATLTVLLFITAIDAFIIEPNWLEINNYTIRSKKLTRNIKIAVLSDLQTDQIGDYEKSVFQKIKNYKPDLILMPGDYIQIADVKERLKVIKEFNNYLKEINYKAPLGVYAVKGNVEWKNWRSIFNGLPIKTIDSKKTIQLKELNITGLGLWESCNPDFKVSNNNNSKFHLVFGHCPDFALGNINADLLVAGHTHGGQVRIPFWGPPITLSYVPRDWAAGQTSLAENKNLIVSKGVGLEREPAPRLRFFCRPELVFIELVPDK